MKSFFRPGEFGQRGDPHQRREDLLVEREGRFDHPGEAAGRPGMAYDGFHRAQGAGELRRGDAVKIGQRLGFGRVFGGRSAAVGFKIADGGRVYLRFPVGLAQRGGIGLGGGGGLVYAAARGETEPLDDGINPVPVADRVLQAF